LKILLDEMYAGLKPYMEFLGYETSTVQEKGMQGKSDSLVARYALENNMILISEDDLPAQLIELSGGKSIYITQKDKANLIKKLIEEKATCESNKESTQIKKNDDEELFQLLDWINNRELTWLASTLALFIALIGLIPPIQAISLDLINSLLYAIIIGTIMICWNYSLYKYLDWTAIKNKLENKSKTITDTLRLSIRPFEKLFYKSKNVGEIEEIPAWVWLLATIFFTLIWSGLFFIKIKTDVPYYFIIGTIPGVLSLIEIIIIYWLNLKKHTELTS